MTLDMSTTTLTSHAEMLPKVARAAAGSSHHALRAAWRPLLSLIGVVADDSGGSVDGDVLKWSGPLAVGETVQVTYSVTVADPVVGDFALSNVVAPSAPGGQCVEGGCAMV